MSEAGLLLSFPHWSRKATQQFSVCPERLDTWSSSVFSSVFSCLAKSTTNSFSHKKVSAALVLIYNWKDLKVGVSPESAFPTVKTTQCTINQSLPEGGSLRLWKVLVEHRLWNCFVGDVSFCVLWIGCRICLFHHKFPLNHQIGFWFF